MLRAAGGIRQLLAPVRAGLLEVRVTRGDRLKGGIRQHLAPVHAEVLEARAARGNRLHGRIRQLTDSGGQLLRLSNS